MTPELAALPLDAIEAAAADALRDFTRFGMHPSLAVCFAMMRPDGTWVVEVASRAECLAGLKGGSVPHPLAAESARVAALIEARPHDCPVLVRAREGAVILWLLTRAANKLDELLGRHGLQVDREALAAACAPPAPKGQPS